jgi:hypothetical protein
MEIGVFASHGLSLLPQEARFTLQRPPMPFNQLCSSVVCHETVRVHSPTIHMTVRSRDTIASHDYHDQVQRTSFLAKEVIGGVVGGSCLRNMAVWHGLESMNKVWEKDGVVDEEDWNIDTNNVFRAWSKYG